MNDTAAAASARKRRRAAAALPAVAAIIMLMAAPASADDELMQQGRQLFLSGAQPACAICHTLADAGASGAIGPVLDEIKPDAARVEKAVRNGLGVMPANKNLSDEQIRLLARYVARATGGAKK